MVVANVVKIKINNVRSNILYDSNIYCDYFQDCLEAIDSNLAVDVKDHEYVPAFQSGKWDGKIHLFNASTNTKNGLSPFEFYTGKLRTVLEIFYRFGYAVEFIDEREHVKTGENQWQWNENIKLYPHQEEAVELAVKKNRGIIKAATSSGKTQIAAGIIHRLGIAPFVFFVTTKDLMYQAQERFCYLFKTDKIGLVGDGNCQIEDITVCTIQTCVRAFDCEEEYKKQRKDIRNYLDTATNEDDQEEAPIETSKYEEIKNLILNAKGVIFDEIHHSCSETCRMVLEFCQKAFFRYGLGATVKRDDNLDGVIEALFGDYICNISLSFLIEHGFVVQPSIYMIPVKKDGGLCAQYQTEYKTYITDNDLRNQIITNIAKEAIEADLPTLVLVKHINHGEKLTDMINEAIGEEKAIFIHGKLKGEKRKVIIEQLRKHQLGCMVSTSLSHSERILVRNDLNGIIENVSIGDFVNKFQKNIGSEKIENYSTLSLCKFNKQAQFRKITHVHKKNKLVPLLEVRSKCNLICEVTDNHSLITSKDNENLTEFFPNKEFGNVIIPKDLGHLSFEEINKINLIDAIYECGKSENYLIFSNELNQPLVRRLKTWKKILNKEKICIKNKKYNLQMLLDNDFCNEQYEPTKKGLLFVENYEKIMGFKYKCLDNSKEHRYYFKFKDVYKNEFLMDFLKLKVCTRKSRIPLDYSLELNELFSALLGFYSAEGYADKNNNSKKPQKRIVIAAKKDNQIDTKICYDKIEKILKELNINYKYDEKMFFLDNSTLYNILIDVFDIGLGFFNKKVPRYIYNAKQSVKEAYLYGLYMGNGSFGERSFDLHTSSPFLARDVVVLLRMLGYSNITCELREPNGKDRTKHRKYIIRSNHNYSVDMENFRLKTDNEITKYRKSNYSHIDGFNYLNPVTLCYETKQDDQYVYDISVDESENFFCGVGPILAHNTLADEGLDIPCLECLILAGSGKSMVKTIQRIGRVVRKDPENPNKKAIVYDFLDLSSKILKRHTLRRMRMYLEESAIKVIDMRKSTGKKVF